MEPLTEAIVHDHVRRIRTLFATIGIDVSRHLSSVYWHLEFPPSRVFILSGMCIFTPKSDAEREIAVISVVLRIVPRVTWAMDITDADSLPVHEWVATDERHMIRMALDPALAEVEVRAFLGSGLGKLIHALSSASPNTGH